MLTTAEIVTWLKYWESSNTVAVWEIHTLVDVMRARRFCAVLRLGKFLDVQDHEIWKAVQELRAEREKEKEKAHDAECESAAIALLNERKRKRV